MLNCYFAHFALNFDIMMQVTKVTNGYRQNWLFVTGAYNVGKSPVTKVTKVTSFYIPPVYFSAGRPNPSFCGAEKKYIGGVSKKTVTLVTLVTVVETA